MPPSLLPPSSGSAIRAAAGGDHEDAVSVHPCVTLVDWWLVSVEGEDQKIAVAGTFIRNQTLQEYSSAPIAKCHTPSVLETEDGTILRIHDGVHNVSQTFRNGYSETVCEKFLKEFPDWWQRCKLLYPKLTNTNTHTDSTQFYMDNYDKGNRLDSAGKYFISKNPDILGRFSHNDAAFQKSSHLLNGTPRLEEYTCDDDIATNENAAASSEAASGDQKTPVVSLEVHGVHKGTQHMSLTEKAAVDDEMPTSVHLYMQNSLCLSNGTPILEEYTCNGDIPTNENAAGSNDDNERYAATSKEANNMELCLVTGSPSRERGHDDIATDVSLAPAVECTNNAVSELVQSTPATGTYRKKTPVASLKSQGSWTKNQHIASNKKIKLIDLCFGKQPVDRPQKQISAQEKCLSATRFAVTKNLVSYAHRSPPTRGKDMSRPMTTVEALNLKRSRSGWSGDNEGVEDAVARRRRPRVAVSKVSMNKGGQPSSSRGRINIGVRKSPLKKVPKPKLQGNEKGATEHFKTRFSVHRILELVPDFDEDQKDWIALSGHGSLLSMSEFSIPVKLVKWIMQHIDPLLCEFRYDDKVIVFDRPLVCKILGFENGTKPLDLSFDVGRVDEFPKIRDQYMDGDRAKLRRCIQVLTSSKDMDSFMRAFMLLALGSVYCPSTTNAVCLKYLHSLYDVSKIKEFDWAGHILAMLMEEVTKYQKLSPEQLERDHYMAGCLAILAIAYMDHLDIPKDRGAHQICYDVPRICNVSKKDFEFVMSVDMQRPRLHSYGRLPFRAVTPYSTPPSTAKHPMADEVHVRSSAASLDDWLHPSGSSNQSAQQVPSEYQTIITETNSLIERDIDELVEAVAADFKVKYKGIYKNRLGEMRVKLINLTHQGPCTTGIATTKTSTSGGVPPSKVCDRTAGQGENNLAQTGRDDVADIEITGRIASIVIDTVKSGARLDSSNAHLSPSSPRNIESPTYCSDIPPSDLFKEGDTDFNFIYGVDKVGTKTGKEMRSQPTTTAPIPGSESKTGRRKKRKTE